MEGPAIQHLHIMYLYEGAKCLSVEVLESFLDVHHVNLTPGHNHTHQGLVISPSTLQNGI